MPDERKWVPSLESGSHLLGHQVHQWKSSPAVSSKSFCAFFTVKVHRKIPYILFLGALSKTTLQQCCIVISLFFIGDQPCNQPGYIRIRFTKKLSCNARAMNPIQSILVSEFNKPWSVGFLMAGFLSVNYSGELILWNISQTGKGQMCIVNPGSSHKGHNRIVFNIATGGRDFKTLVSVSMDRHVSIRFPRIYCLWFVIVTV